MLQLANRPAGRGSRLSAFRRWKRAARRAFVLHAAGLHRRCPRGPGQDSGIDYSDIPPLTAEQLAQFRRPPKVLVAAASAVVVTNRSSFPTRDSSLANFRI